MNSLNVFSKGNSDFHVIEKEGIVAGEFNGVVYVNTTPHEINFGTSDDRVIVLPTSGILVNASKEEKVVKVMNNITYVNTSFIGAEEGSSQIKLIKDLFGYNCIIVGSIIAAQAFPGSIVGLVSVEGYERVAPSEKRMRLDKFTTFE